MWVVDKSLTWLIVTVWVRLDRNNMPLLLWPVVGTVIKLDILLLHGLLQVNMRAVLILLKSNSNTHGLSGHKEVIDMRLIAQNRVNGQHLGVCVFLVGDSEILVYPFFQLTLENCGHFLELVSKNS